MPCLFSLRAVSFWSSACRAPSPPWYRAVRLWCSSFALSRAAFCRSISASMIVPLALSVFISARALSISAYLVCSLVVLMTPEGSRIMPSTVTKLHERCPPFHNETAVSMPSTTHMFWERASTTSAYPSWGSMNSLSWPSTPGFPAGRGCSWFLIWGCSITKPGPLVLKSSRERISS
ncbi:MAG: hypothetical protein BWX71_01142 [Deltaproteobacteria bacterium ADurb.Bin072]|nr:MAG: hypothetical protein BWX71_01142 [Deltaproteobacteria bacterium ADurb.Bin072]